MIFRIIHSPFGQVLKAIRENEPRAVSLGYDTDRYKLLAFVLSSALAGLAGATKAVSIELVPLADLHFRQSGEVVLMTLLGGIGTLFGPVIGAFLIAALDLGDWVHMVVGVLFIVCLLFFRSGIVGLIKQLFRWYQRTQARARFRPDRARARTE
jgi:branched-chain amino acid transport system permease protein